MFFCNYRAIKQSVRFWDARFPITVFLTFLSVLAFSSNAWAQLATLDQKQYEIPGTRIGVFSVKTDVESGLLYDSNIFESFRNQETDDVIYYIIPKITLTSHLPRHSLNFEFGLKHLEYKKEDRQSFTDLNFKSLATIDVRKDLSVQFDIKALREHQKVSFDDATQSGDIDQPLEENIFDAQVSITKTFNRLETTFLLGYAISDTEDTVTEDGVRIDQDFQDNEVYKIGGRFKYTVSPKLSLSFDVNANLQDYEEVNTADLPTGLAGNDLDLTNRDETNVEFRPGFIYNLSSITQVSFGLRYLRQNFDNDALADSGFLPGYDVAVKWSPNSFWSARLTYSWEEDGADFEEDSNGSEITRVGAVINYNPRKYWSIQSDFSYELRDITSASDPREEETYSYKLSTSYAISKDFLFSFNYDYEKEISTSDPDRERHQVQGALKHQF